MTSTPSTHSIEVCQTWRLGGPTKHPTIVRVRGVDSQPRGRRGRGGRLRLEVLEGDLHPSHGLRELDLLDSPNAELVEAPSS